MADSSDRVRIAEIRAEQQAAQREARAAEQAARREAQAERNAMQNAERAANRAAQDERREKSQRDREEARDDARYGGGWLGEANRFAQEDILQPLTGFNKGATRLRQSQAQYARQDAQFYLQDARRDVYRDNQDVLHDRELNRLTGGRFNGQGNTARGDMSSGGMSSGGMPAPRTPMETFTLPLMQAMNMQDGPQRDAVLDQMYAAVERVGPNTPVQHGSTLTYLVHGKPVEVRLPSGPITPTQVLQRSLAALNPPEEFRQSMAERNSLTHGGVAPATQQAAPSTQQAAPGTTPGQTPAPTGTSTVAPAAGTPAPSSTTPAPVASDIPAASGPAAKAVHEKFPALKASQSQIQAIQENLIKAGEEVGPVKGQADGKSGRRTWTAFEKICVQAEPPIDPKAVDFTNPNDPELKRFNEVLAERIAARAPKATQVAADAAPQGPTPDQAAAQRAADRAAQDAREIPTLLNTPYDSRAIAGMNEAQRYELARETLLGIGELKHERKLHNFENMHDKLKEAVRDANKIMGKEMFREPTDQNHPFTNDAMTALGVVANRQADKDVAQGHANPAMAAALARAHQEGAVNPSLRGLQPVDVPPVGELAASTTRGTPAPGAELAQR